VSLAVRLAGLDTAVLTSDRQLKARRTIAVKRAL
jgi:hypothetical protein